MEGTVLNWKYLKFLFWLGPALIVMGLAAGGVAGVWGAVPITLIGVGVAIVVAWLVTQGKTVQGFLGQRSTQVGTNALVATVAVLIILGLINVLVVQHRLRLDLTENQLYTLAPQSQEVVRKVQQPVKLWIFSGTPNPQDKELLENYRQINSNFSYVYVDPNAQPGVARRFGVTTVGEAYLEVGERRRFLQILDDQEGLSERGLTNGIAQITSDRQVAVYFTQGHGERSLEAGQGGLADALSRMSEENYQIEPLNLAQNPEVPNDAAVVVIAGPQRPFLESEVQALQTYLKQKSGLMVLVDPQIDPNLESLLQDWGITFRDRLIVDPAGQIAQLGAAVTLVTRYGDHPITQGFGDGISFYPVARPIDVQPVSGIQANPLLLTNNRTQAGQVAENGEVVFDAADPPQSLVLGVALNRPVQAAAASEETAPSENASSPTPTPPVPPAQTAEARLVAIGNSSFIVNGVLTQQLNGDVFLNAVNWLSQQQDTVLAIRPKEAKNRRILMKPQQQLLVSLFALVFLPLVGFGMGFGIWWKRR